MAAFSLYIHYPFCIKRCPYCGFATAVEKEDLAQQYRKALLVELTRRAFEPPWQGCDVSTIYFGGGTPSLMPPEYVAEVLILISELWPNGNPEREITLEANPETRDIKAFEGFRKAGVNRISMGAQSFDTEELKLLGRAHTTGGVVEAVHMARTAGFGNLSLDLIYGVPGQTVETFQRSIDVVLGLNVDHLSAYTLSIEEGTPFARSVKEKRLPYPDPDLMADQYEVLIKSMVSAGFQHYELTNYARNGLYSRHNSAYWQRTPYLGLGCGAHSFDGNVRFWNRRDTRAHIAVIHSGVDPREGEEMLGEYEIRQESVYLALRQEAGLAREDAEALCNPRKIEELATAGFLRWDDNRLKMVEERWLMLDEVVLRLME